MMNNEVADEFETEVVATYGSSKVANRMAEKENDADEARVAVERLCRACKR